MVALFPCLLLHTLEEDGDICEWMFISGVNDTGDQLFTGVNDTGNKFKILVTDFQRSPVPIDNGNKFLNGVDDTGEK